MEDYELTIGAIIDYKIKACKIAKNDCSKCEALHECQDKQWCSFDTVVRFIEWVNKYNK